MQTYFHYSNMKSGKCQRFYIMKASIFALFWHAIIAKVTQDYRKHTQKGFFPIKNVINTKVLDSLGPSKLNGSKILLL